MSGAPRVGSLFAGVGGFDMGLEAAGFEVAWQVEIDKDAVSVLERHYPSTLRVRDVREAGAHNLTPVDVIAFGSPCQGFSVAGRGAGLEDARSGLFGEAIRIIRELRPAFALWENVPGAYSANDGRDFGAVLAALADIGALDIAWRVLDAQWFGVPQRRRRIFLVADFGGERAASVLFESPSLSGDLASCLEARQGAPGVPASGAGSGGIACDIADTLGVNVDAPMFTLDILGEHAVGVFPEQVADTVRSHPRPGSNSVGTVVASPLTAGDHPNSTMPGRHREDDENLVVVGTLAASGAGSARPAGNANETDMLIPVSVSQNQRGEVRESDVASALGQGGGKPGQGYPAVAFRLAVDSALQIGYNNGMREQTYAVTETRSREVLRRMRSALGEEAFQEWGLGIYAELRATEVLQLDVHGQELRCSAEQVSNVVDDALPRSEDDSSGVMHRLLSPPWTGCPPHQRGSHEQLTRELDAALSELPSQAAQQEVFLYALRSADERLRVLLDALPALQEVGRPEQDRDTRATDVQGMGLSDSGERAESVWSSLHATQESRDFVDKEVGGCAVRRLTPL